MLLLSLVLSARAAADPAREHVLDVLLHNEYGDAREHVVRWAELPTVRFVGGTPEGLAAAQAAIDEINSALAPTGQAVRVVDEGGSVTVYLTTADAMPSLASACGFEFVPGNNGFLWVFWDERGQIYRGVVLIAEDRVSDAQLRHVLLEELTQSLGLLNDSPRFPDSIVYETPDASGSATSLSDLDRRTLLLLYGDLDAGDRSRAVRRAWRRQSRAF